MIRGIGLRGAVAVNVITMIGIGPLITIPLVLAQLHGSVALIAWLAGAVIALCDGLAWAELGSLYPGSGGTYAFVREAFGPERWGRLFAFLFVWQTVLSAPLLLASGYIGFANYAGYLWPPLATNALDAGIVASAVAILTLVLLYRPIGSAGAIGIGLAGVALATLAAVIVASFAHFSSTAAFSIDAHASIGATIAAGLGPALVITLYDYYGYGASSTIGDEVRAPARTLPLSVIASIAVVGVVYLILQIGILGAIRWQDAVPATPGAPAPAWTNSIASVVTERVWGSWPARIVTLAILATAFASTFGNLLAYARIPYAAAIDGLFFAPFARLEARGRFPHVSLLTIGLLAIPACFLSLQDVISALTTGLVIVQSLAQLVAVVALRARGIRAPYRMWLFPLPAIVAGAGWIYIFASAGKKAIGFGVATLAAGIVTFFTAARLRSQWPFGIKGAALLVIPMVLAIGGRGAAAQTPSWGHAATVERDGAPVFEVDGQPFFVYGAAFFYERLPRDRWNLSMDHLHDLGINTLDLYVPWNWHELADGDFDFTGRTNPRRDFEDVLGLARAHGFKIIVRPGPVIRNEWRNGGYPAWLLSRPEYGMPLHDLLEGRYPPTATFQNANSDDAAAQWMANRTHMTYAKRWLETVLHECAPYADLVLAVALDDDQAAYIDNETYPAPHLVAYLRWLRDVVHGVTGPREPVFINTYQMKVTASSPVWAMGNWYQSNAYSIGQHDRAELEFSTALLHTRPHQVMMASEFQAGWLEQADDIRPRPADPSNTSLAMATMIGQGVRGIVNFPAQDTVYPAGWEVPFANHSYAWDAALTFDGRPSARAGPTGALGALIRTYGPDLAAARPVFDAAILYLGASLIAPENTNAAFAEVADATIDAQRRCRDADLSCTLVDPSATDDVALSRYGMVIVPDLRDAKRRLQPGLVRRLAALARSGVVVASARDDGAALLAALQRSGRRPVVSGIPGATFARSLGGRVDGFLTIANYEQAPRLISHGSIAAPDMARVTVPPFTVPAHDALIVPIDVHLAVPEASPPPAPIPSPLPALPPSAVSAAPIASLLDVESDGFAQTVLENGLVHVAIAPDAGARSFYFIDDATGRNCFTTVGAMRDDVALEPPLSTADRIAKYTHDFPAGMFNRPYLVAPDASIAVARAAGATFSYDAPDVLPNGAHFSRTVELAAGMRAFTVDESVTFPGPGDTSAQRAVSVTSLSVGAATSMDTERVLSPGDSAFAPSTTLRVSSGNALGYYDTQSHELATIAWHAGDVEDATILERRWSIVVRLTLARRPYVHMRYGYDRADTTEAARSLLKSADEAAQVAPDAARTLSFLTGKWRNGLRDRLKSD